MAFILRLPVKLVELTKTRNLVFILILLNFNMPCYAGGDNRPAGGKSSAMGGASVGISDLWSGFNNQAGLTGLESVSAGIYYENRYSVKQLGYRAAIFAYPAKPGTLALSVTNFGYSAWIESKIGFGFAKELGKYFSVGVQLDYIRINKEEPYGNFSLITFEAGLLANLSPRLTLGTHIYNPLNAGISKRSDERAPSIIRLGLAYKLNEKFQFTAETEKNIYEKINLKTGLEYQIIEPLFIRAGFCTQPSAVSFGVGFYYKHFTIDFSTSRHPVLGFSPQLSVSYAFK